jgi:hypothetical protein
MGSVLRQVPEHAVCFSNNGFIRKTKSLLVVRTCASFKTD